MTTITTECRYCGATIAHHPARGAFVGGWIPTDPDAAQWGTLCVDAPDGPGVSAHQHAPIDWPAHAWPGGYPIVYLTDDGEILCADCMNRERECVHFHGDADGWRVDARDIHYEGPAEHCAHCGREIPSAYGDPDQ
jgi:hypothetical protein